MHNVHLFIGMLLASIVFGLSCLDGQEKTVPGPETDELAAAERIVLPHSDSVICIAFTPDGKTLISSGGESIRLWDVASGKEKAALTRGRSSAKAVAVSPDGKLLASGNWDATVRLWDGASGREIATLAGHTGPLLTVAFSPDGSLLASGGRDLKWKKAEVKLWDLRTRAELASLRGVADPVSRLAFSPDGKTIAVGDIRGRVFLWDVASKKVRRCLKVKGHTSVSEVIWSCDGRRLVSGGNDIRIWDPARGELLATLPVGDDTDDCFGLAITKDGKLLASGSHRGNIRVWDIATGKVKLTLKRAPPNAKPTLKPIRELLKEFENDVYCVALSPDDTLLAAGVGPTVRIWDIKLLLSTNAGAAEKQSK
jgi:WD40 repeat protein